MIKACGACEAGREVGEAPTKEGLLACMLDWAVHWPAFSGACKVGGGESGHQATRPSLF
jgi:hypothetical protein